MSIQALAADLDGTLLPLADYPQNRIDLAELQKILSDSSVRTLFVTGRHFASVAGLLRDRELFPPDWIIANVGTEIYEPARGNESALEYRRVDAYTAALDAVAGPAIFEKIRARLANHDRLWEQEQEKQGRHKLSYYCAAPEVERLTREIESTIDGEGLPLSVVSSVDPFNADGLIDVLPRGVNKNHALEWWCNWRSIPAERIIYAGDSGNDLHAMRSGYATIVVGNAADEIKSAASDYHRQTFGDLERIYVSDAVATSGVLQGVRHFLRS